MDNFTEAFDDFCDMAAAAYGTHADTPPPLWGNKPVYLGYYHDELVEAFQKVEHPENWKLPFNAVISVDEWEITAAAVEYFTGSTLDLVDYGPGGSLVVQAIGYYGAETLAA